VIGSADLFCCPLTKQDLFFREQDVDACDVPAWRTVAERHALGPPVGLLETADGAVTYPIWKDVIGLLPEFAHRRGQAAGH
jgi:uncharacterized protein YbaR (Trm112 family)